MKANGKKGNVKKRVETEEARFHNFSNQHFSDDLMAPF